MVPTIRRTACAIARTSPAFLVACLVLVMLPATASAGTGFERGERQGCQYSQLLGEVPSTPTSPTQRNGRFVTYNVHYGEGTEQFAATKPEYQADPKRYTIPEVGDDLLRYGATVVALQEMQAYEGGGQYDHVQQLAAHTGMRYWYYVGCERRSLCNLSLQDVPFAGVDAPASRPRCLSHGNAILSRCPIETARFKRFRGHRQVVLHTRIKCPNRPSIKVVTTHLNRGHLGTTYVPKKQVRTLLRWLPKGRRVVVMGDFNLTPNTRDVGNPPYINKLQAGSRNRVFSARSFKRWLDRGFIEPLHAEGVPDERRSTVTWSNPSFGYGSAERPERGTKIDYIFVKRPKSGSSNSLHITHADILSNCRVPTSGSWALRKLCSSDHRPYLVDLRY